MYYIGLDVHKKTISYCVKDASGQVRQEGKIGATRCELDGWMKTLPQPWSVAMEGLLGKLQAWLRTLCAPEKRSYGDCCRLPNQLPAVRSEAMWCTSARRSQFVWKAFPEYQLARCSADRNLDD